MPVRRTDNFDEAETAILAAFSTGLMEVAKEERKNVEKNWDKNRDALGRPWTPLADSTIREKGHSDILRRSGDMRDAMYVRRKGSFKVELGNSDPKINFHEHGTESIPPRPVVGPAKTHLRSGIMQSQLARRIGQAILALNLKAALS